MNRDFEQNRGLLFSMNCKNNRSRPPIKPLRLDQYRRYSIFWPEICVDFREFLVDSMAKNTKEYLYITQQCPVRFLQNKSRMIKPASVHKDLKIF